MIDVLAVVLEEPVQLLVHLCNTIKIINIIKD